MLQLSKKFKHLLWWFSLHLIFLSGILNVQYFRSWNYILVISILFCLFVSSFLRDFFNFISNLSIGLSFFTVLILLSKTSVFSVHGILKNCLMLSFYEYNNPNLSEDLKCKLGKVFFSPLLRSFCYFCLLLSLFLH